MMKRLYEQCCGMYCEPGIICLCYKFAKKSYIVVFKSWNDIIKAEMCHRIPIISMQRCGLTIQDTRQRRAGSGATARLHHLHTLGNIIVGGPLRMHLLSY